MAFSIGSVVAKIEADISGFQDGMKQVEKSVDSFKSKMDDLGSNLTSMGKKMTLFVTTPIVGLGLAAIKSAADFEQLNVALETILGSKDKAAALLNELQDFAKATPFQFADVATGAKQLLAYGFTQEEVIKTTSMLGDVAAGLTIPLGDIIYLYGTLKAQQVAYTKDINQFTNRGIPMWQELANVMKLTVPEVRKLVEAGEVGFPIVEQAFKNLTGEGAKFHDLMQKQSLTTAGQFSNLKDEVAFLARDFGTLLLPVATQIIQALRDLAAWLNTLSAEQQKAIIIIALVVAAIGPLLLVLGFLATGFSTLITIGTALGAVLTFLAANPVVLIIAAIMALIAIGYLLIKNWDLVKEAATQVGRWIVDKWNILVTNVREIGRQLLDAIMWPFNEAKKRIEEAVNWIKSKLDFTKRNSPSIVDIVTSGVSKVNDALGELAWSGSINANAAGLAVSRGGDQSNTNIIHISMAGAMIADGYGANQMAELLGDQIIKRLQNQVRI
jgi:hypothetical protein